MIKKMAKFLKISRFIWNLLEYLEHPTQVSKTIKTILEAYKTIENIIEQSRLF